MILYCAADPKYFDLYFDLWEKQTSKIYPELRRHIALYNPSDKAKQKLQREHITKYIWDNKKKFKILSLKAPKKLAYPNFKFDVNTISELNYLNEFAKNNNINLSSSAEDIIRFKLREEKSKCNFF